VLVPSGNCILHPAIQFCDVSNQSIWMLLGHLTAIVEVLKKELPFDYLTPQSHNPLVQGSNPCGPTNPTK